MQIFLKISLWVDWKGGIIYNDSEYWDGVSVADLETLREELRDLMKFLDNGGDNQKIFYTNFEDDIEGMEVKDVTFGRYDYLNPKTKLKILLDENAHLLSVKKLRENITLTKEDVDELNSLLFENDVVTLTELQENYREEMEKPLGVFLRSITGLEKVAVQDAFAEFLGSGNFSGKQIDLINLVVEHYVRNGTFPKEKLRESPFNKMHSKGIMGLFPKREDLVKLAKTIDDINATADFKI